MAINAAGVGSNLDVNGLVSQLMSAERAPLAKLDTRETGIKAKLSAFGVIRSFLGTFQTAMSGLAAPNRFTGATATSSAADALGASAASGTAPGTYRVETTRLAQAPSLVAGGQASATAAIGAGTISIDFGTISGGSLDETIGTYSGATFTASGTGTRTVTVAAGATSLNDIRDAINAANVGVRASVINDGGASPWRLVLDGRDTGASRALKISVSGDASLQSLLSNDPAGTQNLRQTSAARDAELKINGITVTRPTNTVADAVPGLTLNLLKTTTGSPATVTVARDPAAAKSAAESFVKGFNDVMRPINDFGNYDATTRKAGALYGDPAVRALQSQLRATLNRPLDPSSSEFRTLADIGITTQRDGTLALNAARFDRAMAADPAAVAALFGVVGRPTDSQVQYVGAADEAAAGTFAVSVSQLATRGTLAGAGAAGLVITEGVNDTLSLRVDQMEVGVTLTAGTYASADALALELQSRLNGSTVLSGASRSVQVAASGGVLTLTSDTYGSSSAVQAVGGNAAATLFAGTPVETAGQNAAGSIGGLEATGAGQELRSGDGLRLRVTGGAPGARGSVDFSRGLASQLALLAKAQLDGTAMLKSRTDSLDASVKSLGTEREAVTRRLEGVEKRLRAQFIALDAMVTRMRSTSDFLGRQLSSLG